MLPTFPSRYWFTIGLPGVFSLAGWSPQIRTGFHVPRPTQVASVFMQSYPYGTVTHCGHAFQRSSGSFASISLRLLQPRRVRKRNGLGSAPFARHYSGYRLFFLFLRVLRCFSSPGSPQLHSWYMVFNHVGCPIRMSADQFLFADPRGFSQLTTSFLASG